MSFRLEAKVDYPRAGAGGGSLRAVNGVSFMLAAGEILGLVGESGCGKTTLGRAIVGLVPLAAGEIRWRGRRIDTLTRREFRPLRSELQLVFQDPAACLDPRMTIAESVAEPLRSLAPQLAPAAREARVLERLREVGLGEEFSRRFPHQMSGGQLQRAVIARALVVNPRLVVCDEPVSALDVSIQGQIVNLIARIRRERELSCLFISHNLAVVAHLAARVLVMYRGRIVESASRDALLRAPLHPYARLLIDSVPDADPAKARRQLAGRGAGAGSGIAAVGSGCPFAPRCAFAVDRCRTLTPQLRSFGEGRQVACHRADEWRDGLPPARLADRLTR
jgi:oligopeptide transport system ATP-binding protein